MVDTQVMSHGFNFSGISDILGPLQVTEEKTMIPRSASVDGLDSPQSDYYQITKSCVLNLLEEGISPTEQHLLLPPGLLDDVTNAIWRMAVDEPCGFRGCVLNIVLCNDDSDSDPKKRRSLLHLKNNILVTHKITILLYPDTNSWFSKMARLFRPKNTVVAPHFSSEITRMCAFDY
ncbi:RTP801-like [Trinorchestia longiramus]|nr:RTP801-like [Trinorchestia longiramus]